MCGGKNLYGRTKGARPSSCGPTAQSGPEQGNSWEECSNGASERGDQNISGGAVDFDERLTGRHGARRGAICTTNESCQWKARATRSSQTPRSLNATNESRTMRGDARRVECPQRASLTTEIDLSDASGAKA
uniref:Uncharacterized protein n=1 Tax=Caenorhabditis japonica TaxID=281687 RepID=A0A8R1EHY9_CAEJA